MCFAEKKQPQSLQYISTTKSAQQIIGSIFKTVICKKYIPDISVSDIYHVAIMPCFDKKLEATRKVFSICVKVINWLYLLASVNVN